MNIYKITATSEICVDLDDLDLDDVQNFDPEENFEDYYEDFINTISEFEDADYALSNIKSGPFVKDTYFHLEDDNIDYSDAELLYHSQYIGYDVTIVFYIQTDMTNELLDTYCDNIRRSIDDDHGCNVSYELIN